jgi:hypothetical protein
MGYLNHSVMNLTHGENVDSLGCLVNNIKGMGYARVNPQNLSWKNQALNRAHTTASPVQNTFLEG